MNVNAICLPKGWTENDLSEAIKEMSVNSIYRKKAQELSRGEYKKYSYQVQARMLIGANGKCWGWYVNEKNSILDNTISFYGCSHLFYENENDGIWSCICDFSMEWYKDKRKTLIDREQVLYCTNINEVRFGGRNPE